MWVEPFDPYAKIFDQDGIPTQINNLTMFRMYIYKHYDVHDTRLQEQQILGCVAVFM